MANEKPHRFPLAVEPSNRDATTAKDAKLVNGYLEKYSEGYRVIKRDGYTAYATGPGASGGFGLFVWDTLTNSNEIYTIQSVAGVSKFYKNGTYIGDVGSGNSKFSFVVTTAATPQLAFSDGNVGYHYDSGAGLVAMSGTMPPTTANGARYGLVYLDQTVYYLTFSSLVQGSGLNNVDTWDALNSIAARANSDLGVALAKQLAYVLALKKKTTEVFYDVGNATASPLAPVQGAQINFGCANAETVLDVGGDLFWLATSATGNQQIIRVHALQASVISTPAVERMFDGASNGRMYAWSYRANGHIFYVMTSVDKNVTMAYDCGEGSWSQWADTNGNYLPIANSAFYFDTCVLQHATDGNLYQIKPGLTTDAGTVITLDLYTPGFDASIDRRKTLNLMRFNGDQTAGSVLRVRCNDSDFDPTKWTNFRNVDMSKQRPILTNCGTFLKRSLHIRHQSNTPLRLTSIDLQVDVGTL